MVELYAALHGEPIDTLTTVARDFSPRIERHGSADIVLDVSGLGRLLGDAHAIGAELARAGAARVAVAPSQIGARLLARARAGVSVVADVGALERALGALPLTALKPLTENASSFDVLHRWGLRTLGEFGALPAGELSARLGQSGLALQQLARGIDPRPLVPDPGVTRFIQRLELEWPIDTLEPLSFVFARLLDPLSAALERADRGAAAIRVDLRLMDRTTHARMLQLPAVIRDPRVLRTLLLLDLESHLPTAAVDIVTIEADPAPARIIQYSLLERALPSAETLATLNARLAALVGADRSGSPVLLDSHRPDGFAMHPFDPNGRGSAGPGSGEPPTSLRESSGGPPEPWRRRKLQAKAEGRADTYLCRAAYDGPPLRRFRPPVAVRMTVERGCPVRLAIDRQGMPGGRVTQSAGPWRTSGAWWEGKPWDHDEWDVAFNDGAVCRIFRDRHTAVWFMEGVFD